MIIYHDENYQVTHVISYHDPSYDPACNPGPFVRHDEVMGHRDIHLDISTGADGETIVTPKRKLEFAITLSSETVSLGQIAIFSDVPEGSAVSVNGHSLGVMDETRSLEFEPQTTGIFVVSFSLLGYRDREFRLEVISRD